MTEAEWLGCTDPHLMLDFLRGKASERKLRLIACACRRHICHLFPSERSRNAVEVAERYADELTSRGGSDAMRDTVRQVRRDIVRTASRLAWWHALEVTVRNPAKGAARIAARDPVGAVQTDLLRDIIGNPFRPVTLDPAWLTPVAVSIARRAYEERDYQALPILADALEEAGCDNADILAHCRGQGEHVRGCWVVDLILGKQYERPRQGLRRRQRDRLIQEDVLGQGST
jgi:hypothetical protein